MNGPAFHHAPHQSPHRAQARRKQAAECHALIEPPSDEPISAPEQIARLTDNLACIQSPVNGGTTAMDGFPQVVQMLRRLPIPVRGHAVQTFPGCVHKALFRADRNDQPAQELILRR
jgi:hypothetical protein